jgi:hypothetical protein
MSHQESRTYSAEVVAPAAGGAVEYYFTIVHPYYTASSPLTAPETVHRYPVPASIAVDTRKVDLGPIDRSLVRVDTAFTVWNVGGETATLAVTLDAGNTDPDTAVSVLPKYFAISPGDSQAVVFRVHPSLLPMGYYAAQCTVHSTSAIDQSTFVKKFEFQTVTSIADASCLPAEFGMQQNFPNPFNAVTTIGFQLPVASVVKLAVYDILGREVAMLLQERRMPGRYALHFDASGLPSGVYMCRLLDGNHMDTKKMVLVR